MEIPLSASESKINNSVVRLVGLIALCGLVAQAQTVPTRPDDYVARAKQLIRKLYPGLDPLLRPVIIDGNGIGGPDTNNPDIMSTFILELRDLEPRLDRTMSGWRSDPVLRAHFMFDQQKNELLTLKVFEPLVAGRRYEVAKEVDKHREWSDAQVAAALSEAGAKCGPDHKAEFLRGLPLVPLRAFISGEISVVSAEFEVRLTALDQADLTWGVRAKWHSPDGREADCFLTFEPFEGRLESFSREFITHKSGEGLRPGK